LGDRQELPPITKVLEETISHSQWEMMRAYLWETLPACTQNASPACKPVDTSNYAANGVQQTAWWSAYRSEFVQWLKSGEKDLLNTLPDRHIRFRVYIWVVLTASLSAFVALFSVESEKRLIFLSLLLTGVGGSSCISGLYLASGYIRYPVIAGLLGFPDVEILDFVMPQIWPMLAYVTGMTLVLAGCLVLVTAFIGYSAVFQQHLLRYLSLVGVIFYLICAVLIFPETAFTHVASLPTPAHSMIPTPWPTFTPVPTITPSPLPPSWPVSPGTPLPGVSSGWWERPVNLRCTLDGEKELDLIKHWRDELWIFKAAKLFRYDIATHQRIAVSEIPRNYDFFVLSPSGQIAALADERDVYLYTLPEWKPIFRSRITALARVNAMLINRAESHLYLGLENGLIWVTDIRTGELVTLFSAHNHPVTVLVECNEQGQICSGAADGTVMEWDARDFHSIREFSRHTTAIHSVLPVNDGTRLITLDAGGRFLLWNLSQGTVIREFTVSRFLSSNLIWLEADYSQSEALANGVAKFIVAGTTDGEVFTLDEAFRYHTLILFDSPVHFIYPLESSYLVVNLADGRLCTLGTPE
jgi:hypothetical protein